MISRTKNRLLTRAALLVLLSTLLGACAAPGRIDRSKPLLVDTPDQTTKRVTLNGQNQNTEVGAVSGADTSALKPSVYLGSGNLVNTSGPKTTLTETPAGDITLNFEATPIGEAVSIVLGDYLGQNYVIDPAIGGMVTLRSGRPLRKSDLLGTLETLLIDHNAVLIKEQDLYRVMPLEKARSSTLPSVVASSAAMRDAGFQSVIVPLRYISVSEMEKLLKPYDAYITINEHRNLMIVSGSQAQIAQINETIQTFDVDWLKGMSVGLYPLANARAEVLAKEVQLIMGQQADESMSSLMRLVPVERLNSLMVVTSQPAYLSRIETWIARLDQKAGNIGSKLYIYHVQNGRASDLAKVLTQTFSFYGRSDTSNPYSSGDTSSNASDSTSPTIDNSFSVSSSEAIGRSEAIQITADEINNALLIRAPQQEYKMIEAAIRQLDTSPLQVLVETTIVEVRLTDQYRYGLDWFFRSSSGNSTGEGRLLLGPTGLKTVAPGFSYLIRRAGEVRAALTALAEDSKIEVLSSPSLMVLNNQTATINVGDQVPLPTRQSTSNIDPDAPTVNEIEYRNTGVLLSVTPRVNQSGVITMDISQEVSSVAETTSSQIDAPTILQRQVDSTVAIESGYTVVLGGLIREERADRDAGIPYLYKIPAVGKLFGRTDRNTFRTELVILITPRVIRESADAESITQEFRRKMIGLRPIPAQ